MQTGIINNRYTVVKKLGQGSMGTVFLAHDVLNNHQPVALKLLNETMVNEGYLEIFKNEFEIMSRFNHPHLVNVFDFGNDRSDYYITMEYLHGNTLNDLQNKNDLPVEIKGNICIQLLRGVEFLHSRKILHRDIKPGNVILKNDRVKLLDFGLSDLEERKESKSKGTLSYMAPEVINKQIDYPNDIFSLGLTFFELITGNKFYENLKAGEILRLLSNKDTYDDFSKSRFSNIENRTLAAIIQKMTAFDVNDRYQDCTQIILDICTILNKDDLIEDEYTKESYVLGAGFIGRTDELDALKVFCERTGKSTFLLSGEAGIGKSRLIDELKKHCVLKGIGFIEGHCHDFIPTLYNPFRQILNECLLYADHNEITTHGPVLKKLLPMHNKLKNITEAAVQTPELERIILKNTIIIFLITFSSRQEKQIIFYINDTQYGDDASIEIILELIKRTSHADETSRLKMIITSRPTGLGRLSPVMKDHRLIHTRLIPFNKTSVRYYFQAVFGNNRVGDSIKDAVPYINKKVGGNPFFLQELIKSLVTTGTIDRSGFLWEIKGQVEKAEIPATLNDLLKKRLDYLALNGKDWFILELLAVLNREVPVIELAKITNINISTLFNRLNKLESKELVKKALVHNTFVYTMYHDLLQEEIVKHVADKKKMHLTIANALERIYADNISDYIDELARHYSMTDDTEKARYYLKQAADNAASRFYIHEALALYDSLLLLYEDKITDERMAILLEKARALHYQTRLDETQNIVTDIIEHKEAIHDKKLIADTYLLAARAYGSDSKIEKVSTMLLEAEKYYREIHDINGLSDSYCQQAINYSFILDFKKTEYYINKVLPLLPDLTDTFNKLIAQESIGICYYYKGDFDLGEYYFKSSLLIADKLGHKWEQALCNEYLALITKFQRKYLKALTYYNNSIALAEEMESLEFLAFNYAEKAEILYYLNRLDEAQTFNTKAYQLSIQLNKVSSLFNSRFVQTRLDLHKSSNTHLAEKQLLQLLEDNEDYYNKVRFAEVYSELFRITGKEHYRDEALKLYRRFYENSNGLFYLDQINRLT